MGTLLKVVGAIWALIGLGNIVMMPWSKSPEGILTFGLMFNMLLFIIPGLVVYGIGAGIKPRFRTWSCRLRDFSTSKRHRDFSTTEGQ